MFRNISLLIGIVLLTLAISLGVVRYFAPELLGIASDLQLVQVDRKVPPFFRNIFRPEDYHGKKFIIDDPITKHRALPKLRSAIVFGPHDILGFRNKTIPNIAEVVFIGDSQTYGNNVPIEKNFPSQVKLQLMDRVSEIYNISVGGWGGIQYFDMIQYSKMLLPQVVVVAYYSGNDSLESLAMAYGNEHWSEFIPDTNIDPADLPPGKSSASKETSWKVSFRDGIETVFTPQIRLKSNADHPTVDASWKILRKTATAISDAVRDSEIRVIFTVIPTKELVYAKKISNENLNPPNDYKNLVESETGRIVRLSKHIKSIDNVGYVDLVESLQEAAMSPVVLYPRDSNGHPAADGYKVIADTIAGKIRPLLKPLPTGIHNILYPSGFSQIALIRNGRYWFFDNEELVLKNGWQANNHKSALDPGLLTNLVFMGVIGEVNPGLYGPKIGISTL